MRQRGRSAVVAPHCVFTPSHGTADGRTIPPAYECEHLSRAQHAAGRCQEVAGYEREDGTYVPGHTRCLVDPRAPAWAVQDRDRAVEAMQPGTTLRAGPATEGGSPAATELVLPSDDAGGIDQGNDTFVRPITAPGSLNGR